MSVLDLARPDIRALTPYASARSETGQGEVMLNANESPWPARGQDGLNRYPEPQPPALRDRLARRYAVRREQLLVTRGSDDAIDLLVRAFCRAGRDGVALCPPTFGMYAVCAGVQGAPVVQVPLIAPDFAVDEAALCGVDDSVRLVFLCSPNNPTGSLVALDVVARLAQALAQRAVLVVDEAYVEFAGATSAASLLDAHPNLAVLRTLSKAWALAGARVGALLAHADVVQLLRGILPPYPLPGPSVAAALQALDGDGSALMSEHVAALLAERQRLAARLTGRPGVREVLPSRANFLAVRFDDPAQVAERLAAAGIVVRDITRYPGLQDALRISIGTPAQNDRLLAVLAEPAVRARA